MAYTRALYIRHVMTGQGFLDQFICGLNSDETSLEIFLAVSCVHAIFIAAYQNRIGSHNNANNIFTETNI